LFSALEKSADSLLKNGWKKIGKLALQPVNVKQLFF